MLSEFPDKGVASVEEARVGGKFSCLHWFILVTVARQPNEAAMAEGDHGASAQGQSLWTAIVGSRWTERTLVQSVAPHA